MNIQDAIDVIESVAGFTDESTPVGEAWREALSFIYRPAIKPVPVAERLPGPEDCDERGRCWWLTLAIAEGGRGGYSTFWELTTFEAAGRCASHWRPHHALPIPTTNTETHG